MSVKHVKDYYNKVCEQYHDFIAELKDFEQLCNDGLVQPEVIEQAKKSIAPLKDNWEKLTYIMYLLNKPNKKSKQDRYTKSNYPKQCKTDTYVLEEKKKSLDELTKVKQC